MQAVGKWREKQASGGKNGGNSMQAPFLSLEKVSRGKDENRRVVTILAYQRLMLATNKLKKTVTLTTC